jgi:hypothetical protein
MLATSVSMREFLPGISQEICMFPKSREKSVEKSGKQEKYYKSPAGIKVERESKQC